VADQLIAQRRARRGSRARGRRGEAARDWANECATYWGGSLVGKTARGGENPLNRGKEEGMPAVLPSDSRASCCHRTDGVFCDRVAATLQGLGGAYSRRRGRFLLQNANQMAL